MLERRAEIGLPAREATGMGITNIGKDCWPWPTEDEGGAPQDVAFQRPTRCQRVGSSVTEGPRGSVAHHRNDTDEPCTREAGVAPNKRPGSPQSCQPEAQRAKCLRQQVVLFLGAGPLCISELGFVGPFVRCACVALFYAHRWRGEGGQKGQQCTSTQRVAGK